MTDLAALLYKIDHTGKNDLPTNPDYVTWLDEHADNHPHIVIKELPKILPVNQPWLPAASAR